MANSIYDKDIRLDCSNLIHDIVVLNNASSLRDFGKKLDSILNSYDSSDSRNVDIFFQAQDLSFLIAAYCTKTNQIFRNFSHDAFNGIDFKRFISAVEIAYNLSLDYATKGDSEKMFLKNILVQTDNFLSDKIKFEKN